MSAIYKCCNGSELKEVLHGCKGDCNGSVELDLKGKHHKRILPCLRLLQLKERDKLGDRPEKILRLIRTSLSQNNCAATHVALEGEDNLNSLSYNQFVHLGRGYYWRDFLQVMHMLFMPATGMNL